METDCPSRAPRRLLARSGRPNGGRLAAAIAVIATAGLLAGCGTASSGSGTGTGTGTTSTNGFNPSLVPAGGSSPGTPPKAGKKKSAQKAGAKSGGKRSGGHSGSGSGGSGSGGGGTVGNSTRPAAPVVQTRTVTVSHTQTVTRTVTKVVPPNVPAGAGLPSRAAALSLSSFVVTGGNIGCRISDGGVRCDIGHKVWHPPAKPRSCHAAWAPGLMLGPTGGASFVCARDSVLNPIATRIRPGYDDKVGSVTCQVRSFGVTCFESDGRGFFISRTGYTRF
jgi:hypothetical protein